MAEGEGPTLRACMHALRGSGADAASASKFAAEVKALRLTETEWAGFRAGVRDLRRIDLRIDRIMEADLSPAGAYALGICVALFGIVGLKTQEEAPRKAAPLLREAAELIPVALMALPSKGDPDPERVRDRLERLRARIEAAGIDTGAFGRSHTISKRDIEAVQAARRREPAPTRVPARRLLAIAIGALLLLGVGIAVLFGGGEKEVDAAMQQDLIPVLEITRHRGEVRLRVPLAWGMEDRGPAEAAALQVWRREIGEADDDGVVLRITTGQGRVVARVESGEVRWGQE